MYTVQSRKAPDHAPIILMVVCIHRVIRQLVQLEALNCSPRDAYVCFCVSRMHEMYQGLKADDAALKVVSCIGSVFTGDDCLYRERLPEADALKHFRNYGTMHYFHWTVTDRMWNAPLPGFRAIPVYVEDHRVLTTVEDSGPEESNASDQDMEPINPVEAINTKGFPKLSFSQTTMSFFPYDPRRLRCHPIGLLVHRTDDCVDDTTILDGHASLLYIVNPMVRWAD
jgi:hypothetical protein